MNSKELVTILTPLCSDTEVILWEWDKEQQKSVFSDLIVTANPNAKEGYFLLGKNEYCPLFKKEEKEDDDGLKTKHKIIAILKENPRIHLTQIAKKLGMAVSSVYDATKKIEKEYDLKLTITPKHK